jgi:hypothetical protein
MRLQTLKKTTQKYGVTFAIAQGIDLQSYKDKPIEFVEEIIQDKLTPEQKEICLSVRDNRVTNVPAGHAIGKSRSSAYLVLWWVFCRRGRAITTAPTARQVDEILWYEIRKLYDAKSFQLGGYRNELSLHFTPGAEAFGFTARDTNAFQGIHDRNLLLIIDEADGVSQEIDDGASSCATGSGNRLLRIGNPINWRTPFFTACEKKAIRIPVWNHPNVNWAYQKTEDATYTHQLKPEIAARILDRKGEVKDPSLWDESLPKEIIPGAVSIAWIEEARNKGKLYWLSRVEAQCPKIDAEGIIPIDWLESALNRYGADPDYWDKLASSEVWRLGGDVGESRDAHCLAFWKGPVLYRVKKWATSRDRSEITRAARLFASVANKLGGDVKLAIDSTGIGKGTLDTLKDNGFNAVGCKFGHKARSPQEFINLKAQLYWELRERFRKGDVAIAPLGEIQKEVLEDLASVRYFLNKDGEGEIACEPKEKTRARLKRSPDCGDAVVIGSYLKAGNSFGSISYSMDY